MKNRIIVLGFFAILTFFVFTPRAEAATQIYPPTGAPGPAYSYSAVPTSCHTGWGSCYDTNPSRSDNVYETESDGTQTFKGTKGVFNGGHNRLCNPSNARDCCDCQADNWNPLNDMTRNHPTDQSNWAEQSFVVPSNISSITEVKFYDVRADYNGGHSASDFALGLFTSWDGGGAQLVGNVHNPSSTNNGIDFTMSDWNVKAGQAYYLRLFNPYGNLSLPISSNCGAGGTGCTWWIDWGGAQPKGSGKPHSTTDVYSGGRAYAGNFQGNNLNNDAAHFNEIRGTGADLGRMAIWGVNSLVGSFDGADDNVLQGWACDQNAGGEKLRVDFYIDGTASSNTYPTAGWGFGPTTANGGIYGVLGQCGNTGNHGFQISPQSVNGTSMNNLQDGKTHTIYAYGCNANGACVLLPGSPRTINPIVGAFDNASCTVWHGWTCDQAANSKQLNVDYYIDGVKGTGWSFDSTTANGNSYGNITQCGNTGSHSYDYNPQTSANFNRIQDGSSHTIYAYGHDSSYTNDLVLLGSRSGVTCAAPTPTPSPTPIPPSLGALNITPDAANSGIAAGSYGISGLRSTQGGSNYYNTLSIKQNVSNPSTSNLEGIAFTAPAPTSLVQLKTNATSSNGFILIYANCNGASSCTAPSGDTFTGGSYYIYYKGTWRTISAFRTNLPINCNSDSSLGAITCDLSVAVQGASSITSPQFSLTMYKNIGNHTWGTYGYLYSSSGETVTSETPTSSVLPLASDLLGIISQYYKKLLNLL